MDKQTTEKLVDATIKRINLNYGRGDILSINKVTVTVKRQISGLEYPHYYFDGHKVTFRGVTRTLKYGAQYIKDQNR